MQRHNILQATQEASRLAKAPPVTERAGRVLVVEPDPERSKEIAKVLEMDGYDVLFVADADEVFRLRSEYEPDLLLLSVELPNSTGMELCGQIRANETQQHFPIMLVGYDDAEEHVAHALLAGADDYLSDPRRITEARARVRVQLRHKRFYDTLSQVQSERDSLRRDAETDPLTGLLNRRSLEAQIFTRCERRERFGVLFLDLDHFKEVNDEFGHDMGDRVLKMVAEILGMGIRPGDTLGRFGGEEFIALITGAGPESARLVAERFRRSIEESPPPRGGPSRVTASIGTTVFDPRHVYERPASLLRRADQALYSAKNDGRNRVVMLPPAHDEEPCDVHTDADRSSSRLLIPIDEQAWARSGGQ